MRTLKSNALRRKIHGSTGRSHVRLRLLNCVGLCLWHEDVWILECVRLLWLRSNSPWKELDTDRSAWGRRRHVR